MADRREELAEIDRLKQRLQPLPQKGQDFAFTEPPGADRARIAGMYERLERYDDAVRWYLEAADYAAAVGLLPRAYAWARMALKVNPLDPTARERAAQITAQLGLADAEA
ncbi:MAG: hypothetical protein ACJ790_20025 [Myxococcaceae bacterium]